MDPIKVIAEAAGKGELSGFSLAENGKDSVDLTIGQARYRITRTPISPDRDSIRGESVVSKVTRVLSNAGLPARRLSDLRIEVGKDVVLYYVGIH